MIQDVQAKVVSEIIRKTLGIRREVRKMVLGFILNFELENFDLNFELKNFDLNFDLQNFDLNF